MKDIKVRLQEAEAYTAHGLYEESLEIFDLILEEKAKLDQNTLKHIEEKVGWLKKEIKTFDNVTKPLTVEDISLITKTNKTEEGIPEIIDRSAAFLELGMFKEALLEHEKLIQKNYPLTKLIPDLTKCLFGIHSPSRVIDNIEKIISKSKLKNKDIADIKLNVGQEMEKRGHADLAVEFYESVKTLDPENKKIDFIIDSLRSRRSYSSKYEYLIEFKKINATQLQGALAQSKKLNKSVESVLMDLYKVSKDEIGKSLSFFYKCPFKVYEANISVPYELIRKLKKTFLLQDLWIPLSWSVGSIEVLMENPKDITKIDNIKSLLKAKKINVCIGIKEDIEAFIKHSFDEKRLPQVESEEEKLESDDFEMVAEIEFEEIEEEEKEIEDLGEGSGQVVKLVDQILISAFRKGASDIHIEPSPITKKTRVRFRIDGVCHEILQVPNNLVKGILSRLKIMSGLNIAEKRLPQDGKIKFKRKGIPAFELRMATIPTAGEFEDAVLRILAAAGAMKLDGMGLNDRNLNVLKKIIAKPYGLILVVGPTGSGKTTTLHSALGYINKPSIKIWTAEDPVEITQPGLRQVQANKEIGLDFARIMRAFLRADPDVIMIGEMRDQETAAIGVEASLTGHLVFSTLHTNSAPETVTRLLDIGLNPLNFSDAFLGVLAQRLSRRLCKKCSEEYNPSVEEFDEIISEYGKEMFMTTGFKYSEDLKLYRPAGCPDCSNNGYKGRLGIHELMEGTKDIKRLIKKSAPTEELFEQSMKEGMASLKQDGITKMFGGLTDIKEIRRVCI